MLIFCEKEIFNIFGQNFLPEVISSNIFCELGSQVRELYAPLKMTVVTEMHGWPALQKMYEEGQHGALSDAYVLAQLCCGTKSSLRIWFGQWFGEWLAGR